MKEEGEMKLKRIKTTFSLVTRKRQYVLQFTLKEPWLLPKHDKHYGISDCNLYGWLFVYFGWFN
ncbi:hypothetical protein DXB97_04440 [Firmicutes bacterium OM07-11]|nr:hypothetical protein DXB97_04440 [Firmicutes bacterium OM07-11]